MEHCLTINSIANCLGLTPRMVRMRAKKEKWSTICRRIRGGYRYLFPCATLPDDVRAAIYTAPSNSADAGFIRGLDINDEKRKAEQARLQAKEAGLAAYNALPADRRAEADARLEILQSRDAFLKATLLPKKKGSLLFIKELKSGRIDLPKDVMAAIPKRKGRLTLSWITLYRWEKAYQDQGRAGLAGNYAKQPATSVPAHMREFIQAMIVDHPHVLIPTIMDAVKARFSSQPIPGESSVRRFVKKWKQENASLLLYLTNPDEWKNRNMFAFGDASEQIERLNQLWEFDSTPGDLMLTDGRHTLIGVIDVYSRRAKLLVSPTSKADSIAALTRRAILDWGVPEAAKTDNGSDYVSKHMVRVFTDLDIDQILCPPFTPEKKPHIERFFKTFSHSIVELLPGYIGHCVADRKAIEARRSVAQRLMKQGSDPVEINLSSTEFQEICNRWTRAMYHYNPHSSLNGKMPVQVARDWIGPLRRISDERALDILLSPAPSDGGIRQVGKKGIAVENAFFIAPELAGHEGKSVQVLLDRTDYGTVYVRSLDGKFICKAVNPDRKGFDRAEIASQAKAVQKKVMRELSGQVKKIARKAGTRFIHEEILAHREKQIANIIDLPQPHEEYTSPGLEEAREAVDHIGDELLGPEPIAITAEEEKRSSEVIQLAGKQSRPALPSSPWEKYEFLTQQLAMGDDLSDADLAWMKRYEVYLETGQMADGGLS
jgi:putative transposase